MQYTVIVENDISQWNDDTGKSYHFPKSYRKYLISGTNVVYYKGVIKDKAFSSKRMTEKAHYFGIGKIGEVKIDEHSEKGDLYAEIVNFQHFDQPVLSKRSDGYLEIIPETKIQNYWRNGVRPIDKDTFDKIISLSNLDRQNATNDDQQGATEAYTSYEGSGKKVLSTKYERDPKLREKAIEIHGFTCMACNFNFKDTYGDWGAGFIHVHHNKPLSDGQGVRLVNPATDMIVLCPNCHSMVHRKKNETLSLEQLKLMIKK